MKDTPRILFVASEAAPLVKTGGLADVVNALPRALHELGCDVRVALPCHGAIPAADRGEPLGTVFVNLAGGTEFGALRETRLPGTGVPVYLIEQDHYFHRAHPYHDAAGHEYLDNLQRFAFFCRGVFDAIPQLNWRPDVVHCHDWHAALVPAYLRRQLFDHPFWGGMPCVFTIHNLGYQGLFPAELWWHTGLDPALYTPDGLEYEGRINLMKAGIAFADKINTVSATYAREIQTPANGKGLDGFLRTRSDDLCGIVNGIDDTIWDPSADPCLPATYSARRLSGKETCKAALLEEVGLPDAGAPLFAMVTRLVWDKGIDLVVGAIDALMQQGLQLVVLGSGEPRLHVALEQAAARYPDQITVIIGYNEPLAHRIYAGADFFLMPSLSEPCGLSQLYSLRYGTVPVVRKTGGLADTVTDATPANIAKGVASGVVFRPATPQGVARATLRAVRLYEDAAALRKVQATGMRQDLSWRRASREYLAMYALAGAGDAAAAAARNRT